MVDGIIYRIFNNNLVRDTDYFGSTVRKMKYRLSDHKTAYERSHDNVSIYEHFDEYGFDSFTIEEMERGVFKDRKELRKREQWYKDNYPCCNNRNAYGCELERKKENDKRYYNNNKEKI